MAVVAANAVSPTPATGTPATNGAGIAAGNGNATGGGFIDSLEAVLGVGGAATGHADNANDPQLMALMQTKLAAFKSKLKTAAAENGALALTPQLTQQQAIIAKLQDTTSGIAIPALRAAMAKNAAAPAAAAAPVVSGGAPDASAALSPGVPQTTQKPVSGPPANGPDASTPAEASVTSQTAGGDPSKTAIADTTQQKLVAALVKTANAPVLKDGTADGSKVPNAKVGRHTAQKQTPQQAKTSADAVATKIAATAGITNAAGAAPAAAQGVAVAEVALKTSPAATTITKVETAAISNATQAATHTPAQQASVEAQATPIPFGASQAPQDGKDAGTGDGSDSKNQSGQAGTAANDPAKSAAAPNQASAQAFTPSQPASSAPAPQASTTHSVTGDANANAGLAGAANASTAAPSTAQIAVNLHVAPQTSQNAPPDQTAFAALGVTIAAKSQDGERHFDIRLDPAELGKVDVRISVDSDGKAQAHLAAEHPQTLQLLQNDKINLERQLRDAGLNLANNGLNFSLRGEQQPSTPTFNARNRALSISAVQAPDSAANTSLASLAPGDSRLDIRV
ncbi:MAG: flagellar hook-length control protein FliK [Rhizomicrobium sp.]